MAVLAAEAAAQKAGNNREFPKIRGYLRVPLKGYYKGTMRLPVKGPIRV